MRFKLSSDFYAVILAAIPIALFLSLCAGRFLYLNEEHRAQRKAREIEFVQGLVVQAQSSDGRLDLYDTDELEPLRNKDRIHQLVCSQLHALNRNSMEIIATMPDLQEMLIYCTRLKGPLFEPLAKLPEFRTLTLNRCFLEEDGYKSLLDVKNLRVLTLQDPWMIIGQREYGGDDASLSKVELEKIVNILSDATHLERLTLDSVFGDWQDELSEKLPNTEVSILPVKPGDH